MVTYWLLYLGTLLDKFVYFEASGQLLVTITGHFVSGQYLYLEATGQAPGTEFYLFSPVLSGSVTYRVSFWFHAFGANIGSLSVYQVDERNTIGTLLWQYEATDASKSAMLLDLHQKYRHNCFGVVNSTYFTIG